MQRQKEPKGTDTVRLLRRVVEHRRHAGKALLLKGVPSPCGRWLLGILDDQKQWISLSFKDEK